MPGYDKIPTYLNPKHRHALTQIPPDLSDRDIARYYTITEKERELINRLGFAVQLALLKFPGRTLMKVKEVPQAVLNVIAEQIDVPGRRVRQRYQKWARSTQWPVLGCYMAPEAASCIPRLEIHSGGEKTEVDL